MTAARVTVTADTLTWAEIAGRTMSGYATSVIGCDAEAAIERRLTAAETPDGRPGVSVLAFAFNRDALEKALTNRVGQCVMTCPTTAAWRRPRGSWSGCTRLVHNSDDRQINVVLPT